MPLIDLLLPQFDREMGATRRLLEAAPANLAWAPAPKTRTAAELLTHLADVPAWTCGIMDGEDCDLESVHPPAAVTSTATGLERFDAGAAAGRRALAGRLDSELTEDWTLRRRGRVLFSLPRIAAVQALVLNHMVHHRGQLSVYLRIQGAQVPPLYGPAADARGTAAGPRR